MGDEERTEAAVGVQPKTGEQLQPAPTTGEPEGAAPVEAGTQPEAGAVAGEPVKPAVLPGIPEGMSLEEYVKQAVNTVRQEYEGKGGHLAKLKRTYEKKLAEARKAQTVDARRTVETAFQLAEKDPRQALELLAGTVQEYHERDQLTMQEQEMVAWAERVAEQELGLDLADEAVQKVLEEVGPLTRQEASYELLGRLSQVAIEKQQTRAKTAEEKLKKFEQDLPNLVRQQVATMLVESGARTVDASEPAAPVRREENPIANINNPAKLLQMAFANQQPKKQRAKQE